MAKRKWRDTKAERGRLFNEFRKSPGCRGVPDEILHEEFDYIIERERKYRDQGKPSMFRREH